MTAGKRESLLLRAVAFVGVYPKFDLVFSLRVFSASTVAWLSFKSLSPIVSLKGLIPSGDEGISAVDVMV